ncbi:MAG: hypothetical protein JW839_07630 [Candidatus Lokiarchaeota archaeon]|nr:hypothetical protein [Candidatus Lokiarchaeota archaeon]
MKRENASAVFAMLARGREPPAVSYPAIDILKGLSMLLIWYVHFAWAWHDASWTALFRFSWYILDFFGPSMFVVLSIVGNMAGHQAAIDGGRKPGLSRRKVIKASFLFAYGECINAFFLWRLGWFHLSGWNVITTIALFSLLLPYMLRLRPRTRLAIVLAIFVLYYPLATLVSGSLASRGITPDNLDINTFTDPVVTIYWFFFCQAMMTPLFPWIAVPLLVSVVFERLVRASAAKEPGPVRRELRRLLLAGIALVAAGVCLGLYPIIDFNAGAMEELFVPGVLFTYPFDTGIVAFLVRHVPQYLCFNIGCAAVLFAIISYAHEAMPKLRAVHTGITSFGKLSLTAYLVSHVGLLIPLDIPIELFFSIFLPILVASVAVVHIWVTRWGTVGSLEWLLGLYTNAAIYGLEYTENRRRERTALKHQNGGDVNLVPAQSS